MTSSRSTTTAPATVSPVSEVLRERRCIPVGEYRHVGEASSHQVEPAMMA
jgi:hypothetical protein